MQEISTNLKLLRCKKNLSQKALAAKSNVSQSYISELEKGIKTPSLPILKKLSKGLGCTVLDLIGEDFLNRSTNSTTYKSRPPVYKESENYECK